MARLIVNPDTDTAWDIQLNPGANLLGSSDACDARVQHESIDSVHCQIVVAASVAQLKDLSAAKRTFLNNQPVEQSPLRNGDLIQLGDVVARFESVSELPSPPAQPAAPCRNHIKAPARFVCRSCGAHLCDLCVDRRGGSGGIVRLCRTCGSECDMILARPADAAGSKEPFSRRLATAFTYPFKADGAILLAAGAVFFFAVHFLARFSAMAGLLLLIGGTGYLIAYYQRILLSTAQGEDKMPDWPDFSDWSDILSPIIQFVGAAVISFGPAILVRVFVSETLSIRPWIYWSCILGGCLYFPIGFTAVTMADSLSALNPLTIIPSIFKAGFAYVQAVIVLAAVFALHGFVGELLSRFLPIPIVTDVVGEFLGLYLATVEMRILGLVYLARRNELGWFTA